MGFIKEPKGVDLIVKSTPLTEDDKKQISKLIANYKLTGKKPIKNKNIISAKKKLQTSP